MTKPPKTYAYLRVSKDTQTNKTQRDIINEYAAKNGIKVSQYIEIEISARKSTQKRRIEELLNILQEGDTLIVAELTRLARSLSELPIIIKTITDEIGATLVSLRENIHLNNETRHEPHNIAIVGTISMLSEMDLAFISVRTKEALATKKSQGVKLGKPKGTIQKSKYDNDIEKIKEMYLEYKMSVRKIADYLGVHHVSLNTYIKKRPEIFKRSA